MILATVSQSEPSINVNYEVLAGDTSTVQYSTVQCHRSTKRDITAAITSLETE